MPPRRRRDVALSEARVGRSSSVGLSAREAYVLLSHSQQSATAYVGAATVEILRTTSAPATHQLRESRRHAVAPKTSI